MAAQAINKKIATQNKQLQEIEYYELENTSTGDSSGKLVRREPFNDDLFKSIPSKECGLHVLFLPPIGDDFGVYNVDKKPQSNRGGPGWQDGWHAEQWPKPDKERRDILINIYGLPEWFFENMGWNANGFFGSSIRPSKGKLAYDAYARFLSKEVEKDGNDTGYGWTFMSFYLISGLTGRTPESDVVILLCFDLPKRLCENVVKVLEGQDHSSFLTSRLFSVLPPVLFNVVMVEFERGLWSFQKPVRSIEKRRNIVLATPEGDRGDQLKVVQMESGYRDIYELLRHALHIRETIAVASKSLQAAYEESQNLQSSWAELFNGDKLDQRVALQSLRTLKFSSNLASNLVQRADAFVDRLENEAKIVSSLASTRLLNQTIKDGQAEAKSDRKLLEQIQTLLEQTKNDGERFVQKISVLTLALLPGTLVAGFFGMNFFTLTDDQELKVNKYLYLFFLITFPLTWACLRWLSRTEAKILEGSRDASWYQKLVKGLPGLFIYLQYRTQMHGRHAIESSSVGSQTSDAAS